MGLKYIMLSERNQTQNITDTKLQVHGFPTGLSLAGEVTLWISKHTGGRKMLAEWRRLQSMAPRENQAGPTKKSHSVWSKGGVEHDLLVFERKNTHMPTSVNVAKAPNFYFKISCGAKYEFHLHETKGSLYISDPAYHASLQLINL